MQVIDSTEIEKPIYIHKTCRSIIDYRENVHYITRFKWNGNKYVREGVIDSYNYPEENFYDCPKCEDQVDESEIEVIDAFHAK